MDLRAETRSYATKAAHARSNATLLVTMMTSLSFRLMDISRNGCIFKFAKLIPHWATKFEERGADFQAGSLSSDLIYFEPDFAIDDGEVDDSTHLSDNMLLVQVRKSSQTNPLFT